MPNSWNVLGNEIALIFISFCTIISSVSEAHSCAMYLILCPIKVAPCVEISLLSDQPITTMWVNYFTASKDVGIAPV